MIKSFLSRIGSHTVGRVLTRLVLLVWAIACGANAYDGQYLDAAAFCVGGLLIMQYMEEVEDARMFFDEMEAKNEIWLTAKSKGEDGVTVISSGNVEGILGCFYATSKFAAKMLAREGYYDDTAVNFLRNTFSSMTDIYCEDKGIDKDEFAKRVGFHRVD